MEQATLIGITRGKKGKFHGKIKFADGKTIPIPPGTKNIDETFNNKPCAVLREKGAIVRLVVENEQLFSKTNANHKPDERGNIKKKFDRGGKTVAARQQKPVQRKFARAPYNFIQLNETVVEGQQLPFFDRYYLDCEQKRYTGHIGCELKTLTPLYIRDTYTKKELLKKEGKESKGENGDNPDFFSPGNKIKVPGSSLRGMVRTLVEIIGWGKFGFFESKRRPFYRDVGGTSDLAKQYRSLLMDENKNCFPKIKAGILKKSRNGWAIYPSKEIKDTQFYKVEYNVRTREVAGSKIKLDKFSFKKIFFQPVAPTKHTHRITSKKTIELKYAKVCDISSEPVKGYEEGYIISAGDLGTKKHMHWIINMSTNVPSDVLYLGPNTQSIELYKSDETRDEQADLFKMLDKHPEGVPCFYIKDKDQNVLLGHTGMFRLPYNYTIGDYVPEQLTDKNTIDMAENIFGKPAEFATRVYFEDAQLLPGQGDVVFKEPVIPEILGSPKPTTFQHYLEPDKDNRANHWNAKSYNSDVKIRGNKLYWHRNNRDWCMAKEEIDNEKLITKIKPVRPNTKFKFRIRFENLTREELGLLLCALVLPKGCCHKLGMGKPLGLGSVEISATLCTENRKERYSMLFDQDQWYLAAKKDNIESFKQAYEKYLLGKLAGKKEIKVDSMWETQRLRQLKIMLSWENTKIPEWCKKTSYIEELKEFQQRRVLPKPEQVYKKQ